MDTKEIQTRLDALSKAMTAKGLRKPMAEFELRSNCQPRLVLSWEKANKAPGDIGNYKFFEGEQFSDAMEFVAALPSPEETKFKEFMSALGGVIDLGKENGIEVEFLNPLVATMKTLSENAITYQPNAALAAKNVPVEEVS